MWNWQQKDWPHFSYDAQALNVLEAQFLHNAGESFGTLKHITKDEKTELHINYASEEALRTSAIEGEILNRDSLQASLRRQFHLTTDHRRIPAAEQGITEMMVNLYQRATAPLAHTTLYRWHSMLMNGRRDLEKIGAYRTHDDPMQIISGNLYESNIHFEAPPSQKILHEMKQFIHWFKETHPRGKTPLPALTRTAISHLYFTSIHPFEDGNGRIGRALAEKSLAEHLDRPTLIALSYVIEKKRKTYYHMLETSSKTNQITDWILYFAQTILDAQEITNKRIEFTINKAKLFARLKDQLNPRQEKALKRICAEGIDGFAGGLSAKNYATITKAPHATVTRDLQDLVTKKALTKTGTLKHTRYHVNLSCKTNEPKQRQGNTTNI